MNTEEVKDEICRHVGCENYLEKSKNNLYCCPFCESGKGKHGTGALKVYRDTNEWHCHKCGKHGDVIDLMKKYYNTDYIETLKIGAEKLNIDTYDTIKAHKKKNSLIISNKVLENNVKQLKDEEDYTSFFLKANKDIEKTEYHRGLSLDTLNRFKIGFVEKWKHPKVQKAPESPRLIIPTSKYSYLARDVRDEIPEKERPYSKSKVGNLHFFNVEALQTATTPIFIVEGELDALSIIDVGGEAVSLGTTSKIKSFLELVSAKKPKQPLVIALDNDEAGKNASQKFMEELKRINIPHYKYNIYGKYKDANEALQSDRESFAMSVSEVRYMYDDVQQLRKEEFYNHFALNRLQDFMNGIKESVNTPYISTGFESLDEELDGGLYEGLYIIGAISSLGKTTLALQICDQIAQDGGNILIFSLEMSANELIAKSISRHTLRISLEVNQNIKNAKTTRGITTGSRYEHYSSVEKEIINNSIKIYKEYAKNICIYEGIGDMGVTQVREKIEEFLSFTGKRPVVLIDYVQILAPSDIRATDKQNTDKAVIELKRISRDYKIPVIGISSFNRLSYKGTVTMEAFKESGSLEYGSDVLIGLQFRGAGEEGFDVNEAKMRDPREIELVILKNRNGAVGKRLDFNYYPMFNCFVEGNKSFIDSEFKPCYV